MSLELLGLNSLHIVIYARSDPPEPNDFHWGLYLHQRPSGGTKYHVRGRSMQWIADHADTKGVFADFLLIGLCQIATIPVEHIGNVDSIFRTYDRQLNDVPGLNCRTWVLKVLEALQKSETGKIVFKCHNLAALEQEVLDFGNANAESACLNHQPRPLVRSALCGLREDQIDTVLELSGS